MTPVVVDIINHSTVEGLDAALPTILVALGKQLALHVQPFWGRVLPTLRLRAEIDPKASPIAIFDNSDQAGALGYHDQSPEGIAYARVFARTILAHGGTIHDSVDSISVAMSHEIAELVCDPAINYWAENNDGHLFAVEVCDAIQDQAYLIDDVYVSDFLLPAFFNPNAPPGTRLDYLHKLSRPFTMTRGGYQIRRAPDGSSANVYGSALPDWKRTDKEHPAARTARRTLHT